MECYSLVHPPSHRLSLVGDEVLNLEAPARFLSRTQEPGLAKACMSVVPTGEATSSQRVQSGLEQASVRIVDLRPTESQTQNIRHEAVEFTPLYNTTAEEQSHTDSPLDREKHALAYSLRQARKRCVDTRSPTHLASYLATVKSIDNKLSQLHDATFIDPRRTQYFTAASPTQPKQFLYFKPQSTWTIQYDFSFHDLHAEIIGMKNPHHIGSHFSQRNFWRDVARSPLMQTVLILHSNLSAAEEDKRTYLAMTIRKSLGVHKTLLNYRDRAVLYRTLALYIVQETHPVGRRAAHRNKYHYEEQGIFPSMKPIEDGVTSFVDVATSIRDRMFTTLDGMEQFASQLYGKTVTALEKATEIDVPTMILEFLTHLSICVRQLYTAPTILDQLLAVYAFGSHYTRLGAIAQAIWKYAIVLVQMINQWKADPDDTAGELEEQTEFPEFNAESLLSVSSSQEFAALLTSCGKYASSASNIIRFIESMYKFVCFLIDRAASPLTPDAIFRKQFPEIADWILDVQAVLEVGGVPELAKSVSLSLRSASLHNRGLVLARDFHAAKPPPEAIRIFGLFLAEAKAISVAAASASQGLRVAPVVVWLEGGPGTGKTNCVQALVKALSMRLQIEDASAQIFQKPGSSDYWNGYCNQLALLIDDFGQSTAIEDRRKQALDVIYAASTNPYILDMADVNSKGNFAFTSRIIFVTTNMEGLTQMGITSDKAFERRVDIRAQVGARPEFALVEHGVPTQRVDPKKLEAKLGHPCAYNAHAVQYTTLLGDQTVPDADTTRHVFSFSAMVDELARRLQEKQDHFQQAISAGAFAPLMPDDVDLLSPAQQEQAREEFEALRDPAQQLLRQEIALFGPLALAPLEEQSVQHFDLDCDPLPSHHSFLDYASRQTLISLAERSVDAGHRVGACFNRHALSARAGIREAYTRFRAAYERTAFWTSSLWETIAMWSAQHSTFMGAALVLFGTMLIPVVVSLMKRKSRNRSDSARKRRAEVRHLVRESGETRSVGARVARRMPRTVQESGETRSIGARVHRKPPQPQAESGETRSVGRRVLRRASPQHESRIVMLETPFEEALPEPVELQPPMEIQDTPDLVAQQLIDNKIYQQLHFINVYDIDGQLLNGAHCLALGYRAFWVPFHMTTERHRWHTIHILGCTNHRLHISNMRFVAEDPETDCAIVEFSRTSGISNFKDLRSQFVSETELTRDLSEAALVSKRIVGKQVSSVLQYMYDVQPKCLKGEVLPNGKPIQVLDSYFYPHGITARGDCGSPLVLFNRFVSGKIMGFHYLGYKGARGGISSVVTREYVAHITRGIDTGSPQYAELQGVTPCYDLEAYGADGYQIIGTVPRAFGVYDVGKTSIKPSPFYEMFGPSKQAPAMLARVGDIDPMAIAQKKNFGPTYSMDQETLSEITNYVTFWLQGLKGSRQLRLLSQDEAFNGIVDDPHCEPMNLRTSAGFPYRMLRPGKKLAWLTVNDDQRVIAVDPKLQADIDTRISNAKAGIISPTVWIDTLKDERRPLEKVAAGKSRLFMNGPVDFTVVFRIYFGSFISLIMHLHAVFECSLGINPHSRDWGVLAKRLNEITGQNFIAGDFSNYDGSILAQLIQAVTTLINELYDDGPENARIREVLMADVYNAIHLDRNTLYQVFRGNPSGNPLTTVMNSLVNTILMLYAWKMVGYNLSDYEQFVRACNFGDDNVLKVHPSAPAYTMRSIAQALQHVGITYTPASKNDVQYDYIPFSEVTYLKRSFVTGVKGIVFAPLNETSRDEMLYWYRDGNDVQESLKAIVATHMSEAVHYGEKFYNARAKELVGAMAKRGIVMPELSKSYKSWLSEWYEDTYTTPTPSLHFLDRLEEQALGSDDDDYTGRLDASSEDDTVDSRIDYAEEGHIMTVLYIGYKMWYGFDFPTYPYFFSRYYLSHSEDDWHYLRFNALLAMRDTNEERYRPFRCPRRFYTQDVLEFAIYNAITRIQRGPYAA